ncbi:MAG: peptidyl-tRNA hydrolase [Candidatus Thorarchaeota archaeon]|nr:peptidyl-tRNA hydrolase [Candidatus Thorarchaeota archaeon]
MTAREFKYKQIIAVRTDLAMSKGKTAVQVAHGSVTAAEHVRACSKDIWKAWFKEGQKKVVVKVSSEEELLELRNVAIDLKMPFAVIQDAGMTELPPGTTTVIGIGPGKAEEIDRITGNLKLL